MDALRHNDAYSAGLDGLGDGRLCDPCRRRELGLGAEPGDRVLD